ncbi:DedA family protein [Tropicibacter naphthalenivorans]|uniref:Inner membrane protein YqjA n=1 Tax=Tropicibacter naphthalenivorans TaxID=441103 RepID=A0A0P1G2F5_9RHOB|nr:DedA family protein [Tropicibacter naphthalenivorans]CUH75954.1 Inner membrane protein YqjA [Tropicibacter naphthalenivorans]SMC41035.1 membrane protein DedA, SNARE-associated domain [Tropicibacter naphthalenivorans]
MFDFITNVMSALGAFGVASLMFLENVFPPIPSELIMPLAGFNAARGAQTLWIVILAGTVGSLAGAIFWYWLGRRLGARRVREMAQRHGRWLTMTPEDVDRANDWFHRHGRAAVVLGRLVPTVRTLISVPAGVACMPVWEFALWSTVGTAIWTALLTLAGYVLESQYELVSEWLNPVSTVLVVGFVLVYVYRVVTFGRRMRANEG